MEMEEFLNRVYQDNRNLRCKVSSKKATHQFADSFVHFLFPFTEGGSCSPLSVRLDFERLQNDFRRIVAPLVPEGQSLDGLCHDFFGQVPGIYDDLMLDAQAILRFDPAAESLEEIILTYPGFFAIAVYRMAHALHRLGVPVLPRVISEYAHGKTGIDIHPGARIGKSFFIDHGTGVVIGGTSLIRDNVRIYQGVTLGALSVRREDHSRKRHPTIEDNVTIYAGSTVLGGDTVIGANTVIGGNVWLTESVPPNSIVYHKSQVRVRNGAPLEVGEEEPLNFVI